MDSICAVLATYSSVRWRLSTLKSRGVRLFCSLRSSWSFGSGAATSSASLSSDPIAEFNSKILVVIVLNSARSESKGVGTNTCFANAENLANNPLISASMESSFLTISFNLSRGFSNMVLTYHTEALEGYYTIFSFPKCSARKEINTLILEIVCCVKRCF